MSVARPFRWAILGTGEVSRRFVRDLHNAGGEAHVVASRNPENASRFAESLSVPHVAKDYAQAVSRADVDAVYIATPPALHEPHAMMAIEATKPVLIEKPFTMDATSALRVVQAARAAQIPCIEAMWSRFQPFAQIATKMIAAGDLGEIRGFDARFMAANEPSEHSNLFNKGLGGGALLHRGVYPLSLARHFLGPVAQMYPVANIGQSGVDEESVLVLRHENGALSTIRSSLCSVGDEGAFIAGTKATLHLSGPIYRPTGAVLIPTTQIKAGARGAPRKFEGLRESQFGLRLSGFVQTLRRHRKSKRIDVRLQGNGYHYQAKAMHDCIRNGLLEADEMPLDHSLEVMRLIDEARASWEASS